MCSITCLFVLGSHVLVASGIVHSIDPSRIICKRILLSGHPLKVHKRSAVIRYMFFTRGELARVFSCISVCGSYLRLHSLFRGHSMV